MPKTIKYFPEVDTLEHDDSQSPETKRVSLYGWDSNALKKVRINVDTNGNLTTTLPLPTQSDNPSLELTWDGSGNLTALTKAIGSDQYQKTLTWDVMGNLTNLSASVKI